MPAKRGKPRRGWRPVGDRSDPEGFGIWAERYLGWLATRNYSQHTVDNRHIGLRGFVEWCEARSLTRPSQVTKPILERYQRYLYLSRRADGRPQMSFRSHTRLTAVRGFFKWLVKQNALPSNPASELRCRGCRSDPARKSEAWRKSSTCSRNRTR